MIVIATLIPTIFLLFGTLIFLSNSKNSSNRQMFNQSLDNIAEIAARQSDRSNIKERLSELNSELTYKKFRLNQLLTSTAAGFIPILLATINILKLISGIGLSIIFFSACYFYLDYELTKHIRKQRLQIESEFPAVIEILTLAIGAGDSPLSAFSRIANRSDSLFAQSMRTVIIQVKSGVPFQKALDQFSQESKSMIIRRFVDALVIAMTRGAPIVDVLHRHVSEARINNRNLILNKAGKTEITMMIPIVFLILPISVLFALWPSMSSLSFFAG